MIWTKGDTRPLDVTLTRSGTAIDLTGATIEFHMTPRYGGAGAVNAACTILDALTGRVRYTWTGAQTEVDGLFDCEWQITSATKDETVPPGGDVIEFLPDLAD